ncbi:hypothetical protein QJQ45_023810 [Haematococcus lacustris]|nr:hypothetical protein QJQ45_023810 [Haematococcus lacustris]
MLPSVRLLNPSSPRRPVISPQMALHVTQRPATKQEKTDKADTILAETVVDYAKLHQIKLNKNYGEARIWADISHLSQKKLRAENLLNDDDEGRQFTDKQCKVLWQKLVESWRKINDYITNKRTGGGPPFFELPDDERKQMANLTGKYKNMKEDLFTIMSPAMANDSASLPACLVSGGVCTEVTKRGRGSTMRAYCSDDDEDQETREARQWDDYRKGLIEEVPGEQRLKGDIKRSKHNADKSTDITAALYKSMEAMDRSATISSLTRRITTSQNNLIKMKSEARKYP